MNKIINENHICTFCDSTEKPFADGDVIRCPCCNMPQFEGVVYDSEVDFSILNAEIVKLP